jgi:hypothetical protein
MYSGINIPIFFKETRRQFSEPNSKFAAYSSKLKIQAVRSSETSANLTIFHGVTSHIILATGVGVSDLTETSSTVLSSGTSHHVAR